MDMNKIVTSNANIPDFGARAESSAKSKMPLDSFQKMLENVAAKSKSSDFSGDKAVQRAAKKGWREIEKAKFAQNLGTDSNAVELDSRLQDILAKLKQLAGNGIIGEQDLLSLLAELKQQLRQLTEENGQEIAGQQLLLFFTKMPMQDLAQKNGGEMPQLSQAVQESFSQASTIGTFEVTSPEQLLQLVMEATPEELAASFKALLAPENKANQAMKRANEAIPQSEAKPLVKQADTKVFLPEVKAEQEQPVTEKTQAEHEFSNNIRTAKQGLEQETGKQPQGEKKPPGIDDLQHHVNSGTFLRNTAFETIKPMAQDTTQVYAPLQAQLEEGLLTGIKAGDEQFMIRLMPEGLGEVTVHLTKTPEGMLLNIAAKNGETQKLLMQEIGALRENLRAMNVEIKAIDSEQPAEMMFHQQNFNGQQQHHRWQDFNGPAYYGDEPLAPEVLQAETEQPEQIPLNPVLFTGKGNLNAYI